MLNKRTTVVVLLALLAAVMLSACAAPAVEQAPARYETVSQAQIQQRLPGALDEGMILLDVRTQPEWEQDGHIAGATLIPVQELANRAESELPDKSAEIVVYCRSGNRSQQATQMLLDMGYTNVKDMGGINDWKAADYAVEYGP